MELHAPADPANPCAHHNHRMVFHSCVCAEILFNGWSTSNELQLFGSALAILVAAALYEGFKSFRESLSVPAAAPAHSASLQHLAKSERAEAAGWGAMCSGAHLVQTALHALQSALGYVLMLVFMTYNVWLCAALVLGLTLGYFVFGVRPRRAEHNDPCH